mgnify:CR=1 FL=1
MKSLLAAAIAAEILSGPYRAEVVRVIDGDTFVALSPFRHARACPAYPRGSA